MQSFDRLYCDAGQATDLYTRQCSLNVTAKDLAVMGATLADGGVNPLTKERVVDAAVCHYALAVMATAGMYETSGDWLYEVGLPGKSGIGGGIVTVSAGQGRAGHLRAAARRRRQQRQGAVGCEVSVATTRARPVRFNACVLNVIRWTCCQTDRTRAIRTEHQFLPTRVRRRLSFVRKSLRR